MSLELENMNRRITFSPFDKEDEIEIELDIGYEAEYIHMSRENVKTIRNYLNKILGDK